LPTGLVIIGSVAAVATSSDPNRRSEVGYNLERCHARPERVRLRFNVPHSYRVYVEHDRGCHEAPRRLFVPARHDHSGGCADISIQWEVLRANGHSFAFVLPQGRTLGHGTLHRPLQDRNGHTLRNVPGRWREGLIRDESSRRESETPYFQAAYRDHHRNRFYQLTLTTDASGSYPDHRNECRGTDGERRSERAARTVIASFAARRTDERRRSN
jgi:hypothetical protein